MLLAAIAALALPGYEHRRDEPLVDPVFFRSVPFTGAFVVAVTAFVVLSGFLFLNTLYLQDVRGCSALHAGPADRADGRSASRSPHRCPAASPPRAARGCRWSQPAC